MTNQMQRSSLVLMPHFSLKFFAQSQSSLNKALDKERKYLDELDRDVKVCSMLKIRTARHAFNRQLRMTEEQTECSREPLYSIQPDNSKHIANYGTYRVSYSFKNLYRYIPTTGDVAELVVAFFMGAT